MRMINYLARIASEFLLFTVFLLPNAISSTTAEASGLDLNIANIPPAANDELVTTNEDSSTGVMLTASDADGDLLSYAVVTLPAHGSLSGSTPNLTYTPASNYNGIDSFTFKANDGSADSNVATVTIAINPVNDAPGFTKGGDQTVPENSGTKTVGGWASNLSKGPANESGQTLSFIVSNDNNSLFSSQPAISGAVGTLSFTPAVNASGAATVTLQIHDNGGTENGGVDASAPQTFTITVTPNIPPVAADQSLSAYEDRSAGISLSATDVDRNSLTYLIVTPPAHGSMSRGGLNGQYLSYFPSSNYNGPESFTFKANDGTADSNIATVSLTILPVNDAPVAVNDSYSTNKNLALNIAVPGVLGNDADIDSSNLIAIKVTEAAHGTLTLNNDGSFTYTPPINYTGSDSFNYQAGDGSLVSNIATVTLDVVAADDIAPAITSLNSATFTLGTTGSFAVTTTGNPAPALDKTGALPAGVIFSDNNNGTATFNGTPGAGTEGNYTLIIRASSTAGSVDQAFNLIIVPPKPQEIADTVDTLIQGQILSQANGNSLTGKLDTSQKQLDNKNPKAAMNALAAFINEVKALINSGRLTEQDGKNLIDAANSAIKQIGSSK